MHIDPRKKKFFKADNKSISREPEVNDEQVFSDDRLEGRNPIMEALRAGRTINKIWIAQKEAGRNDPALSRILALARDKGIIIHEVPRISLDQMSESHSHQGIIARRQRYVF